jgi:hypothetical protein
MAEGVTWQEFWAEADDAPAEPRKPVLRSRETPPEKYHEQSDEEQETYIPPPTHHRPVIPPIQHKPDMQTQPEMSKEAKLDMMRRQNIELRARLEREAQYMQQMQLMEMHRVSQQQILQQPMMPPLNNYQANYQQPWFSNGAPYYYYDGFSPPAMPEQFQQNQMQSFTESAIPPHMTMMQPSVVTMKTDSPTSTTYSPIQHRDRVPSRFGESVLSESPPAPNEVHQLKRFVPPSGNVDEIMAHYAVLAHELSGLSESSFMACYMDKQRATQEAMWNLGLELKELNHIITEYYPSSWIAYYRIIPPDFLLDNQQGKTVAKWISHPMMAAAVLGTCFQPRTGKLWNSKLSVDPDALSNLIECLYDWLLCIQVTMARSTNPIVPLEMFLETKMA